MRNATAGRPTAAPGKGRRGVLLRGFTLIELVIVVAIVAILTAIAVPSYEQYLRKGRRAEAQAALMDMAQRQQQFLIDARAYATSVAELKATVPASVSKYYTITVTAPAATPPAFTITAEPKGAQAADGPLSVNNLGVKTPAGKW